MVGSGFWARLAGLRRPALSRVAGLRLLLLLLLFALSVARAEARPTSTLPKKMFMLDVAYAYSWVRNAYDNQGRKVPLLEPMHRYEPGGGLQGIIIPNARVTFQMIIPQIRYGILDYFNPIVLSVVFGWRKPDPRIFLHAASLMGVQPRNCAYVGDTISRDVLGARRAGFGLVIRIPSFLSSQVDKGDEGVQPDAEITDLREVLALLRRDNFA